MSHVYRSVFLLDMESFMILLWFFNTEFFNTDLWEHSKEIKE